MLTDKEFKRWKELKKKFKTLTPDELNEFKDLDSRKGSKSDKRFVPGNDFSWWNKYPELMGDAANLLENYLAGTKFIDSYIPVGAITYYLQNTYGSEDSVTGPINLASRNLYLKMFQKYRGITSYDPTDLGIVMIATIEVFTLIAKLERIYGVINFYDVSNRNIPETLCHALGLTTTQADYIRAHLSDYRYDLNNIIMRAQRILLPKDMSILLDKLSLYGYVYKDHDSTDAQAIVFDTEIYGFFEETMLDTGSSVRFRTAAESGFALLNTTNRNKSFFPLLEELVSRLLTSESVQKIYGDLLAFFGIEQMVSLQSLPADYKIQPVYSESILHKIHNMEITSSAVGTQMLVLPTAPNSAISSSLPSQIFDSNAPYKGYPIIYQFDGVIYTKGCLAPTSRIGSGDYVIVFNTSMSGAGLYGFATTSNLVAKALQNKHVIDAYHEKFTPEIVCEGTLWKFAISSYLVDYTGDPYFHVMDSCALELCYKVTTYNVQGAQQGLYNICSTATNADHNAAGFSEFDWSPLVYELNGENFQRLLGDHDCMRALANIDMTRIHDAATLSAFKSDIVVVKDANIGSKTN